MKKKFLTFALVLSFIVPCMFMLTACGTMQLEQPSAQWDNEAAVLTWTDVANADYYMIRWEDKYSDNSGSYKVNKGVERHQFSEIDIPVTYDFSLIAYSNSDKYEPSSSALFTYVVYSDLADIAGFQFNEVTNKITWNVVTNADYYDIFLVHNIKDGHTGDILSSDAVKLTSPEYIIENFSTLVQPGEQVAVYIRADSEKMHYRSSSNHNDPYIITK